MLRAVIEGLPIYSRVVFGDWGILDTEHFLATGEMVVIGTMTQAERECRDAWALADPEIPKWTVSRLNRLDLPRVPSGLADATQEFGKKLTSSPVSPLMMAASELPSEACSQCGKYPCECDDC